MTRVRAALVLLVVAGAALAGVWASRAPAASNSSLAWIATAHQFGPVGYRDPAGAISPDGKWIAYSEGRYLRVRPIDGGPITSLPPGGGQIRWLAWSADNRSIVADGDSAGTWAMYDRAAGTRTPLWAGKALTDGDRSVRAADLRQLAWSGDGRQLAAIANGPNGSELWRIAADGGTAHVERLADRASFPAWTPAGDIACIVTRDGRSRVTSPCGGGAIAVTPEIDVYGPMVFTPDGGTIYISGANPQGTVDLFAMPAKGGAARRMTSFSRDSYAPSAAADGSIVFRVQSYRTAVAVVDAGGGPSLPLATFQSETPSWHPDGKSIGITYGTWRRVPDDAKYPDIAQDAGIIGSDSSQPASKPAQIVHDSVSEDQALCWSPNGKWIAFHSHKEQSDDIWLRLATGDPAARRITMLGRGFEAGWPRWSADGKWLLFTAAASRGTRHTVMYLIGMDQASGAVTSEARAIALDRPTLDVLHAEWLPDNRGIVLVAKEGPGRHAIYTTTREGGAVRMVHEFTSEHDAPGLGVSPAGTDAAFIAPAADGFFQLFRIPLAGGSPIQITSDPTNKTQPAWSPDGARIAFTVWNYDAQFWRLRT